MRCFGICWQRWIRTGVPLETFHFHSDSGSENQNTSVWGMMAYFCMTGSCNQSEKSKPEPGHSHDRQDQIIPVANGKYKKVDRFELDDFVKALRGEGRRDHGRGERGKELHFEPCVLFYMRNLGAWFADMTTRVHNMNSAQHVRWSRAPNGNALQFWYKTKIIDAVWKGPMRYDFALPSPWQGRLGQNHPGKIHLDNLPQAKQRDVQRPDRLKK